jgi:hypothetical protein
LAGCNHRHRDPQREPAKVKIRQDDRFVQGRPSPPQGSKIPVQLRFHTANRGPDGDPTDVLLVIDEVLFPGCCLSPRGGKPGGSAQTDQTNDQRQRRLKSKTGRSMTSVNGPDRNFRRIPTTSATGICNVRLLDGHVKFRDGCAKITGKSCGPTARRQFTICVSLRAGCKRWWIGGSFKSQQARCKATETT